MPAEAQIDPDGTVKGQYVGPVSIVAYVWRKQSG
jgi:hypothetical protein